MVNTKVNIFNNGESLDINFLSSLWVPKPAVRANLCATSMMLQYTSLRLLLSILRGYDRRRV